ncbi:hypothetical protein P170DRAFT_436808 [Aspergillus steynii IBT 23096]|uniref:Signal peptide peptidase n=1 Tax=Aspergillus steynii IBT 23096 TaxID=1392250 RepID=A0A2I2G8H3_9EURO|nr:uncharacterized protein P170DRAFT_436808 [Aspergillus steynii IBT 23096]PLB49182.1 hypothetical protein P170DRAFT_436808 [Aspergillus steynii IBT 23096]
MDEVSPFAEFLGQAIYHLTAVKPLVPTYAHLLVSALFPIYIGAHASLSRPTSAAKRPKNTENDESEDEDDEDQEGESKGKMESLEPSDAIMFPLTAGLTLGGLYLVIKYMGAELLNKILGFYFSQMGMFFAVAFLRDCLSVFRSFAFPQTYTYGGKLWKVQQSDRVFKIAGGNAASDSSEARRSPLPGILGSIPLPESTINFLWTYRSVLYQKAKFKINIHRICKGQVSVDILDLFSTLLALPAVGYFAFVEKPWWLTNFLGFSFCYGVLQFMSPSTFLTGSLILGSLFFYDIYFVYFTPLMVTVAKSLDVPIKLLFPRPAGPNQPPDTVSLAMLGLGDIVIPGMMVGHALRFDLYLYYLRKGYQKAKAEGNEEEPVKPVYQSARGGWGERFWTKPIKSQEAELEPPYQDARLFPKTYFKASIVGYLAGMIATLVVMQCFNHPQPALLYLVPGVLISLWGTAFVKGDIHHMWNFSDSEEDEEDEEADSDDKEKEKQEEEDKNVGFFSKLFNRYQRAADKAQKSEEASKKSNDMKKSDKAGEKKSDKHGKAKDKDLDLFSFSFYIPRKSKSAKSAAKPAETDKATDDSKSSSPRTDSPVEDENWAVISSLGPDNEPPTKRQRRSPRHAAKTAAN